MSTQKTVWADCRECCRSTRHEILCSHTEESDPEGYHESHSWQVIRCLGCHTCGFRLRHDDYEMVMEEEDGKLIHDITITQHPSVLSDHKALRETYLLPPLIQKVYKQTLKALSDSSFVLAGIGLRACIEAVCNELKVSGTNLERRIDQLFKAGHVSNGDKRRLHAIRFLGNDAAHEIKEPKDSDIRVALDIVEHLLNSVFLLENKAKVLDTVAENYDDFLKLLNNCALHFNQAAAVSLASLLGRKRRLVSQGFDDFEQKAKQDVADGKIPYLKLGQVSNAGGKDVQLYEFDPAKAKPDDDDIPF
ncbi:hypothetical protein RGE_37180 [Rubrivivax gelatinosus IL144]|uniref:DUF4145 domain-containing protein n=2 Tax=Rubrivivax gelatinosus TaxID=28068 RepID=I0HVM0_RUBGI|nr:hypothetical protein RGE_37180 [Rubrivivax gelatinosus IL144]